MASNSFQPSSEYPKIPNEIHVSMLTFFMIFSVQALSCFHDHQGIRQGETQLFAEIRGKRPLSYSRKYPSLHLL